MELKHWWLGLTVLVVLAGVGLLRWRLAGRPTAAADDSLLAANLARLRQTERFRILARRQTRWLVIQLLSLVLMVLGTGLLVSRLMSVSITTTDERGKDIVLCVDTSASNSEAAEMAFEVYLSILEGLTNERVALVLWNRTAMTVFPLVSDHDYVEENLRRAYQAVRDSEYPYLSGTLAGPESYGSSLIGAGLLGLGLAGLLLAGWRTRS